MSNQLLQIIFQNGTFENEGNSFWGDLLINILGAAIGAAMGFYGAWYIFRKTLNADKEKIRQNDVKIVDQRLHYFSSMVVNILKISEIESEHIKKFIKDLELNPTRIPFLEMEPIDDLKRFSEIQNHEDYYHAYLTKFEYKTETVNEYRKIYTCIDFLKTQLLQFKEILEKSMQYDFERTTILVNTINSLILHFPNVYRDFVPHNTNLKLKDYIESMNAQYESVSSDGSDLRILMDKYIFPMLIKFENNFQDNPNTQIIKTILLNANNIYATSVNNNKGLETEMNGILNSYNKVVSTLKPLSNNLAEKFKS